MILGGSIRGAPAAKGKNLNLPARPGLTDKNIKFFLDILEKYVGGIKYARGRTNTLMQRWTFDLSAAGNQTINLAGNFVYGYEGTDADSNVNIEFSRKEGGVHQHPVVEGFGYRHPFDRLHVNWAAQDSDTLTIIIGNLSTDLFDIIDNRSAPASLSALTDIETAVEDKLDLEKGSLGTAIYKDAQIANATGIIHTVTAGKTLFMTGLSWQAHSTVAAVGGEVIVLVRNAADALQYEMVKVTIATSATDGRFAAGNHCAHACIQIAAGFDICVVSNAVGINIQAFLQGWEV